MQCNVGKKERILRILSGLVATALGLFTYKWLIIPGAFLIITAVIAWCPVSTLLGVSTCPSGEETFTDSSIREESHPMRIREADKKE